MARDYKHSGKTKRKRKDPVPGWIWLVTGLTIGLLVALLVYLGKQPLTQAPATAADENKTAATADKPSDKEEGEAKQPLDFEFYTLLPESEVVIPEEELDRKPDATKPKPESGGTYMLQAGSFRHPSEAETLKGELALLGIVADIQRVTIKGDQWFRVRIGPFSDLAELNRVRRRLRSNQINSIPLQVKG